jgi:hypothetical protein
MGLLDVITGKLPLFKSCNVIENLEADFIRFLNSNPSDWNHHHVPYPASNNYTIDHSELSGSSGADSAIELRQVTNILSDGVNQFQILKNSSTAQDVQEISVQPNADCHLQIFEGNNGTPITAIRFVQANSLWSVPGKVCKSSLFIACTEGGVGLSVEVRSISIA